jgi:Sec-independent protein translocase protein TatA
MLNIGLGELLLVAIVMLVVCKPEDLPGIAHKLGQQCQKAKHTLRTFKQSLELPIDNKPDNS